MSTIKPLTKTELISTLQEMNLATKDDLLATERKLRTELVSKSDLLATERKLRTELVSKSDLTSMATKEDIKNMATKSDLTSMATKEDIKNMATKSDLTSMATKEDIKNMATKDDLKNEILASERRIVRRLGKVKADLAGRIASLALTTPTIKEFKELKLKVERNYAS